MNGNNVEKLERMICTRINSEYRDIPPTEEQFLETAGLLRQQLSDLHVSDQEYDEILVRLRQNLEIKMDVGMYIEDIDNGHKSWLPAKRADIDFFFWNRYKTYLEIEKNWNPRVTSSLGNISDEILDLCGNPEEEAFAIKGLVLGDVQSGKTANYTAICNKAADAGYRIIIILTGIQENLRRQTQERLDSEFSGRKSEYFLDPNADNVIKNRSFGVGRFGKNKQIASFTSVTKDFDIGVLRSNRLGIESVNCPILLVVKKNKSILNNLIKWLSDNNTLNADGHIELPLMLIDDEADNASINTKKPEVKPTAINDCIRRLLKLFSKTTYLGITATPFANIFIDPDKDEDLFPSDFIYVLSPPTNYIGAERLFGDKDDCDNILVPININDFESCFPPKHKKDYKVEKLPDDLYEAVCYFILVNAIRDKREGRKEHRSMMIHLSFYIDVQRQIADILRNWLDRIKSDLKSYSKLSEDETEKITNIKRLHLIWDKYKLGKKCDITWNTLLNNYLYRAVAPIDIRAVNSKTRDACLDYFNHKDDGLRVIAVGGNSLSRGLTLEGLCVSYFHRSTKMYDTLMQMGRWFGYRPNYEDIVKVWMTDEVIDWYGQITRATSELKDEIARMRNAHQTPREFGLKVRQDPGALIVTARNKMRTAQDVTFPVTVSGCLLETPRLKASPEILESNEREFKNFVNSLAENGDRLFDFERTKGNYYWEHVPSELISQLLFTFDTHPWHLNFNGIALSEYIEKKQWSNGWDVVLISGGEGDEYPGGIKCGKDILRLESTERRYIAVDAKMLSVSGTKVRVGAGECTKIGLTPKQITEAREIFIKETGKKNVPDKAFLIKDRAPILMLHVIQANYKNSSPIDLPPFLFALGVGFPMSDQDTIMANYKVNKVEWRNWTDFSDDPFDEEDF